MSKEEIENMKLDILNLHHMLGKKPSISKNAIKNALKYIDQLELDKQKLIEKLEEDIKQHTYGDIEIDATGQYAKEILEILK